MRVAVIGGGWAGLAAAVEARARGQAVTLLEMAPALGGRARRVEVDGLALDNGQHILLGAYRATLALMRRVGADPDALLQRLPLTLVGPDGSGLALRGNRPLPALARAVLAHRGWPLRERLVLLWAASGWRRAGFRCDPALDVASWSAALPARVRAELIEPLAVAALNTPLREASAAVFLNALGDALAAPGSADLLLPRAPLDELLPAPAERWLRAAGAELRCGTRVRRLEHAGGGLAVDGERFDALIVAASAVEAARLTADAAPAWSAAAAALQHQPIATVYLEGETSRWPCPMVVLRSDDSAPAQFAFDLGALGRERGLFAFVVSAAADWVARGVDALAAAVLAQAGRQCPGRWRLLRTLVDRRATFACTPGLRRPPMAIAPGLLAAADYIDSPYPGTLEAAVRAGVAAARNLSACDKPSAMQNRAP